MKERDEEKSNCAPLITACIGKERLKYFSQNILEYHLFLSLLYLFSVYDLNDWNVGIPTTENGLFPVCADYDQTFFLNPDKNLFDHTEEKFFAEFSGQSIWSIMREVNISETMVKEKSQTIFTPSLVDFFKMTIMQGLALFNEHHIPIGSLRHFPRFLSSFNPFEETEKNTLLRKTICEKIFSQLTIDSLLDWHLLIPEAGSRSEIIDIMAQRLLEEIPQMPNEKLAGIYRHKNDVKNHPAIQSILSQRFGEIIAKGTLWELNGLNLRFLTDPGTRLPLQEAFAERLETILPSLNKVELLRLDLSNLKSLGAHAKIQEDFFHQVSHYIPISPT